MANSLTKEWYSDLQKQASENFINLPIEMQLRGYDYAFLSKHYLQFFSSQDNDRQQKLQLAKKFLKFIRSINKNRAKHELNEDFFLALEYFYDNFSDLIAKQDMIHFEALSVITEAIDRSNFLTDVINVDELHKRIENLNKKREKEEIIDAEWSEFEQEYDNCQMSTVPQIA